MVSKGVKHITEEQGSLTYSLLVQNRKEKIKKKNAQNHFTILSEKWSHDKMKQKVIIAY